jgi:hypothetical protein
MKVIRIGHNILLLSILIGLLIAGCGVKSPPDQSPTEAEQEPPGQIKKTEEIGESDAFLEEENILPTDLSPTEEPTSTTPPKQIFPDPTKPAMISDGENEGMVSKVKADLASRLGVSQEGISLVSMEAMVWNDSSLGCPSPGGMYLQVLTPGYKITLSVDGKEYVYHTDEGNKYLLCNNISL